MGKLFLLLLGILAVAPSLGAEELAQTTPPSTEVLIPIRKIEVQGSTILSPEEIKTLTAPLENKSVSLSQLRQLAEQITNFYQQRNYITSRAFIPPDQNLQGGVIRIQVIEGTVESIQVSRSPESTTRLNESYVRDRLALGTETPLNFTNLEEELQLLRSDPLVSDLKANLVSGSSPTSSVLQVTFREATSFSTRVFTDNFGNTSTGIYRAGIVLTELNTSGAGDVLSLNYTRSGTADGYGLFYQYPLNPRGGTISFSYSGTNNPFTFGAEPPLRILTTSQIFELSARQPLLRNPREEFALSGGVAFENSFASLDDVGFNFNDNTVGDGLSQARILRFGQDYTKRDEQGAWALRSNFNLGIGALGATLRDNAPDGRFFSWVGQFLRVQRIGGDRDSLAFLRFNVQLANTSLLSLNKFSVGGAQTVRGYRQNQIVGDNGIQASLELQFPVIKDEQERSIVKIHPFIETGTVWNNNGINPTPQTLFSLGIGASYQPISNLVFRLDVGVPLINANNPGTNLQDSGIHFSVNGNF